MSNQNSVVEKLLREKVEKIRQDERQFSEEGERKELRYGVSS